MQTPDIHVVLDFWFKELEPADWWRKSSALDALIGKRFGSLHAQAVACELWHWRTTPHGRLAEIIVLDQFSRNIYRGTPAAFAADGMALVLAQQAVADFADHALQVDEKRFLYLPWMHSESLAVHEQALRLFAQRGLEDSLEAEHQHRDILLRFGRYPHRNAILGRASSAQELAFLQEPGSSF